MAGGLLVIGDVVTDVVATPLSPLNPGTDTAARIQLRPGGSGGNTAGWAAHCGASVTVLARVGSDSAQWHTEALERAGVRPRLRVESSESTAVVLALIDPEGERSMITDRGAGAGLSADDFDDDLLGDVGHLHLSGYVWFSEAGAGLAKRALAAATARGVTASVDPASTGFLTGYGVARFCDDTAVVGTVLPNVAEARLLSGARDDAEAARLLSRRHGLAAVTLGADGAVVAMDGELIGRVAGRPASVVDAVGAGDAFTGGFLAARLAGADPLSAAEAGCRAGELAVTITGGRPPQRPGN